MGQPIAHIVITRFEPLGVGLYKHDRTSPRKQMRFAYAGGSTITLQSALGG